MNALLLLVLLPLFSAFLIPLLARVRPALVDALAAVSSFAVFMLSCLLFYYQRTGGVMVYRVGGFSPSTGTSLVLDGLSGMMVLIVSFVSLFVVIYSIGYMKKFTEIHKYYTLLLLMISGLFGVILTGDIFNMYIFLELVAITSYALVSFGCEAEELEGSFKYMVIGTIASLLILFSVGILYAKTGTLNMALASEAIARNPLDLAIRFSLVLFVAGFLIKCAAVPFHAWLPYAHPAAPAPISAMLSSLVVKVIGIYALIRVGFNVFPADPALLQAMMALGGLSMTVGAFMAIGQTDLKRIYAYSTISQVGYILLGIGLFTPMGLLGGLFHLFNHAFMKSLLFLNAGAVEYSTGTRDIRELGGLKEKMPVTYLTNLFGSLSVAGMPPFNGFWSKLMIILALVLAGRFGYALLAALVSIVTLSYLLKAHRHVFRGRLSSVIHAAREVPLTMAVSLVVLALACLGIGLFFGVAIEVVVGPAVQVILNGRLYSLLVLGG